MAGPRIAVLGTGAIGAPLAGLLTRAGHDVVLIDQWPEHVEAMRTSGLRLTIGPREAPEAELTIPVRALHLVEVCTRREPFDIVFVASKSYDTRWLVTLIEPYLAADGVVVSVQNSLNDEWIAPIVGPERSIGCALTGGGELLGPGHAWRNRRLDHRYYTLGEPAGPPTPRLARLASILADAGRVGTTDNLWGVRWSKLIHNSVSAALSGLVARRQRSWQLMDDPTYRRVSTWLYREGTTVAREHDIAMEPLFGLSRDELLAAPDDVIGRLVAATSEGASPGAISMVQQDLAKGRPTEIPYFNGLLARKGHEVGVRTPLNDAVAALYRELEAGAIEPGAEHLLTLEAAAPA